ncbi:MAG: S-layer homology domain-containing protein, partial [Bacillota bacterium]
MKQRWTRTCRAVLAGTLALGLVLSPAPALAETEPALAETEPVPAQAGRPRLGEVPVSREAAVARARELLPIPAELGEPEVNLWQSGEDQGSPAWRLAWDTGPGEDTRVRYSVTVDATTGEILRFDVYRWDEKPQGVAYTRKEALRLAEEWLRKLAGPYAAEVRLEEREYWGSFRPGSPVIHGFAWKRVVAGHPVPFQRIAVGIDAQTGELASYSLSWPRDVAFDPPDEVVDAARAEASFRAAARLGLVYVRFWDLAAEKEVWRLIYAPVRGLPMIDAGTGEALTAQGRPARPVGWEDLRPFPAPAQPYNPPAAPLTQEQALALARSATGMTGEPSQVNYQETSDPVPGKYYHFTWSPPGGGELKEGEWVYNVTVDAARGVVAEMHGWTRLPENWEETPPAVDLEEARAAAEAFLLRFRPDLVPGLRAVPEEAEDRWCRPAGAAQDPEDRRPVCSQYDFSFVRTHNGIPIEDLRVTVGIDPWSGRVVSFRGDEPLPGPAALPPGAEGVLTPEAALERLLTQAGLELQWVLRSQEEAAPVSSGPPEKAPAPRARLVYAPREGQALRGVDAFTGDVLDYGGYAVARQLPDPEDIAGHPVQREIELLLLQGVLEVEPDGKFYPDRPVTRAEAARWLVLARGLRPYTPPRGQYSFPEYAGGDGALDRDARLQAQYVEAALRAGILVKEEVGEAFAPDRAVTREEFALWAVRAMGYGA